MKVVSFGHFGCVARRLKHVKNCVLEVTNLNLCLGAHTHVAVPQIILLKVSVIRKQREDAYQNRKSV